MIQVRRVEPKDLEYIVQNSESLGFDLKLMSSRLENMMLVIDNHEICGIGFYINTENKCIINWVHIKTEQRRNGLGSMLVKTMLNNAEQQGALQAFMPSACSNFAEFLGFQALISSDEIANINKSYKDLYLSAPSDTIYKVSLIDYFKPCSCGNKCT